MRAWWLLVAIVMAPVVARGDVPDDDGDGNPDNFCRNGQFPDQGAFAIARTRAAVVVIDDAADCPVAGRCGGTPIGKGAEVIVGRTLGRWQCVWHFPARGDEIVGWVATTDLRPATGKAARGGAWTGTWRDHDNELRIARRGTGLAVEGEAYWHGWGDNVHEGAVVAEATPDRDLLFLEQDGCQVELHRVGRYLIAHDNRECGGANMVFDGVYRRR